LQEWTAAYPQALKFAAPGLSRKRNDIEFDRELRDTPEDEWKGEIAQTIFKGSPAMEEVVFYHRLSNADRHGSDREFSSGHAELVAAMVGPPCRDIISNRANADRLAINLPFWQQRKGKGVPAHNTRLGSRKYYSVSW